MDAPAVAESATTATRMLGACSLRAGAATSTGQQTHNSYLPGSSMEAPLAGLALYLSRCSPIGWAEAIQGALQMESKTIA